MSETEGNGDSSISIGSKDHALLARMAAVFHVLFKFAEAKDNKKGTRSKVRDADLQISLDTLKAAELFVRNSSRQKLIICEVSTT